MRLYLFENLLVFYRAGKERTVSNKPKCAFPIATASMCSIKKIVERSRLGYDQLPGKKFKLPLNKPHAKIQKNKPPKEG